MYNMGDKLYKRMPNIYVGEDPYNNYALKKFLSVLGVGLDEVNQYIDALGNITDLDKCPKELLPLLAEQYGFKFPYDMDEKAQRKFIKVIPYLYKYKGTDKAYKFLAREVLGEGTVTTIKLPQPPPGVAWDDWIKDPATQEEWQKIYVETSVNGEESFLSNKVSNFAKFAEMLRPVNTKVVPKVIMYYADNKPFEDIQELYEFDELHELHLDDYDSKRLIDSQDSLYISTAIELESFDLSKVNDSIDTSLLILEPDLDIFTKIKYDEHVSDAIDYLDSDSYEANITESSNELINHLDTDNFLRNIDGDNEETLKLDVMEEDTYTKSIDEVILDLVTNPVEDDKYTLNNTELYLSTECQRGNRPISNICNFQAKLVTNFYTTDVMYPTMDY